MKKFRLNLLLILLELKIGRSSRNVFAIKITFNTHKRIKYVGNKIMILTINMPKIRHLKPFFKDQRGLSITKFLSYFAMPFIIISFWNWNKNPRNVERAKMGLPMK